MERLIKSSSANNPDKQLVVSNSDVSPMLELHMVPYGTTEVGEEVEESPIPLTILNEVGCWNVRGNGKWSCVVSVVYGDNFPVKHVDLWTDLVARHVGFAYLPWAVMGNFNSALSPSKVEDGSSSWFAWQDDLGNCLATVYWSSIFILPKAMIKQVEATLRAFLWKGCDLGTGETKVAWTICKDSASSLWVSWARSYLLKGRSIEELKCPGDCSWSWKKILKIAGERIIHESRLSRLAKVANIVEGDSWRWSSSRSPVLSDLMQDALDTFRPDSTREDVLRYMDDVHGVFSVRSASESIRLRFPKVTWYHIVWFPKYNPRHAFILWLAI
ncbi:unnamed protein product [Fraxinus pennsylvanica]|uniref:Reverse transcriptase zinc-binding domain-containing protein n=1 Tax=Fraxinus pennsylvanica TaxID=56036 RepID=A0AAD2A6Q7_9LAMI|nr:unnamed protein product [Fraxinus pennsylvanica]